jgi:Uma2 family endonuclease
VLYFSYPSSLLVTVAGLSAIVREAPAHTMYLAESSWRVTQITERIDAWRRRQYLHIDEDLQQVFPQRAPHRRRETAVSIKTRATIEDLYKVEGKAELVNGEIVHMSPTGRRPGRVGLRIAASLLHHEERVGGGIAFPDNVGFIVNLPHRESFSPDAAWYTGPDTGMRFCQGAPVFAVEVRSQYDYGPAAEQEMQDKRTDYFACGTLVVWDVDLLHEDVIKSYKASDPAYPVIFRRGDNADAEPAVSGWQMAVNDLFE